MPKPKTIPRANTRHPDPAGEAWQAEASRRWEKAHSRARRAGGDFTAIEFYDAPALPAFTGPAHVTRPLLGRYLVDRDAKVVHDTAHALESCGIDGIRNGTFVHFKTELDGALPPDGVDCACMGGDA